MSTAPDTLAHTDPATRPVAPIPLAMMTAGDRSKLRDDIAIAALPAILAELLADMHAQQELYMPSISETVAVRAYHIADAMLKARGAA